MRKIFLCVIIFMLLTGICNGQRNSHCDTLIIGKSFNNIHIGIDDSASICRKIKILKNTHKTYISRRDRVDKTPTITEICLIAKGVRFFINCKDSNETVMRIEIDKTRNVILVPMGEFFVKKKINTVDFIRFGRPTSLFRTKKGVIVFYEQKGVSVEYNRRIREKSISIFKPDDDWKSRYSEE